MSTIKKILVPFEDNIMSIRALEYAAMFATGIGAKITVFHLADSTDYQSLAEFKEELNTLIEEQFRPKLKSIQQIYPDLHKIAIQTLGLQTSIHKHIVGFAKENAFDLIIMRSHKLKKGDDWELHFKDTNAYKVTLEATCPVFTFTNIPEKPKLKNILMPIDLSEGSLFKVPYTISLAKQFGSTIHLLSASENSDDIEELQQQIKELYRELEDRGVRAVKNEICTKTLPEAISDYTNSNDIDLIVIMSRPKFRWSDLWISPKAKKIISHSKIPVISMRSDRPMDIEL
ncbi:MAG: universal stress protein [Reichenbachiella sp.]|uniref:universal stress protein n=1 Tax=Reichenbachiella sp. TaxID=2184521 RepID=UPI00326588BC